MTTDICCFIFFFFFNDTATTEIYTLSLHDALPIYGLQAERLAELLRAEEPRDGAVVVVQGARLDEEPQVPQAEEVARPSEVALDELAAPQAVLLAGVFEEAVEIGRAHV